MIESGTKVENENGLLHPGSVIPVEGGAAHRTAGLTEARYRGPFGAQAALVIHSAGKWQKGGASRPGCETAEKAAKRLQLLLWKAG